MDTFYWFRDGQFGEVQAYTWQDAMVVIGNGKFAYDPTGDIDHRFCLIDKLHGETYIPRWAVPKEFLVRLVLLGVGI